MSAAEVTKTEEPVAAPAPVLPTVEATEPAVESKVEDTPTVAEPATAEEAVVAPVEEFKEEGVLAYKGPGLLKSIFPSKKFFWFGSEPIEEKSLTSYLRGEKDGSHNVAWAAHTGEGLLLFSKKASEKATPAGIINLSDISDVTVDGTSAFHFILASHKHSFEASTTAERDNWVAAINTKAVAAKELAPTVTAHETYKNKLEALKPAVVAAPVAAKKEEKIEAKEEKKEEKAEAKEEKKEEKAEAKEEKKEEKKRTSRSASRKRASIFGAFGLGKEKKEETPVVATEPTTETAEISEVAPVEEATPAVVEPVAPATEEVPALESPAAVEPKPTVSKRNSFFGTIGSKFNAKKDVKSEEAAAPAVPAKDAEPVSETAPVIPAVEATEPLATTSLTPATVPTETITNGETKALETPATAAAVKDKRKSSLPWLSSKKEKATSEDETEKPKSPFSKIRNTFKGPKTKTPTETSTEATETPAVGEKEAKVEEPVVAEPVSAAPASAPIVAATA